MEELSNFVFFRVVYEFIHSEIDEFAIHLLSRVMVLATSAALTLLTLWILIQGYRIATGQSRQSMMGLVADSLRTTLILGLACGMAVGGSTVYEFLGSDLPNEISDVVTGSDEPIIEQIDRSLALMQVALTSIDSLEVGQDPFVNQDKTRALWFTGLGTAGPALMGGGVLLMNQIAMALFIGLGPLFVLSLLFEQTKGLFGKWLYYGIGTMFSLAVLSVMITMALDMVLAVGAAFWLSGALGADSEGITSLAMQQGGLGLILTMLILSAPPMAAAFFNGVLGNFSPLSAFGGGGPRRESEHAVTNAHGTNEIDAPMQIMYRQPTDSSGHTDEIKTLESHVSPAVHPGFASGMPATLLLPIDLQAVAALAAKGNLPPAVEPSHARELLEFQEQARLKHAAGDLSDADYAAARHATSLAYHAEIEQGAPKRADAIANDKNLTMQEKYDFLYGMGAKAGVEGFRLGIDYPKNGPVGGNADEIGKNCIAKHHLFDPSRPTRVYINDPRDASEPLRALLGLRSGENITGRLLNERPGVRYATGQGSLIESEPWMQTHDLVGQIVQQNNATQLVAGTIAQRTFEGVEDLAGSHERPYSDGIDSTTPWAARNEKNLSRVDRASAIASAAGFASELSLNAREDYLTIDVFASKENQSERMFVVRKFEWKVATNQFHLFEPLTSDPDVKKIVSDH